MLVRSQPAENRTTIVAIAGLCVGLALGAVFAGTRGGQEDDGPAATDAKAEATGDAGAGSERTDRPADDPATAKEHTSPNKGAPASAPVDATFPLLQITVAAQDWAKIVTHRERSVAENLITRDDNAIVPAQVRVGDEQASGTVRLKGDWPDHVLSNQWSLRLELDRPVLGMRRFSIQHPATRHLIMEWLVMQTARRAGLLTPRCQFVHAAINGQPPGFYYLEEHPTKEMLESQGRRDGPIVKFDEAKMWATWRQFLASGIGPALRRTGTAADAAPVAFGERRLQRNQALNARLMRALAQLDALREMMAEDNPDHDALRRLHALHRLAGQTVDELFDTEQVGRWLALNALFHGLHGQGWHQLRFYHNPMTDRLEPVVFDTGADIPPGPVELALHEGAGHALLKSPRVLLATFEALARMTRPGWLEQSTTQHLDYIRRVREAFMAQPDPFAGFFELPPSFDMTTQFEGKAEAALKYRDALRQRLSPDAAATFAATTFIATDAEGLQIPMVEVDAWACTTIPVRVQAFAFSNGREVPAAGVLVGYSDVPDSLDDRLRLPDGGVLLPTNGSPLRFRLPADQRLLGLNQVQAIKRAIRQGAAPPSRRLPKIDVVYRTVGAEQNRRERLRMRQQPLGTEITAGRPAAPTLTAALERHPFLAFDLDRNRLSIAAGRHLVQGDLLLPENQILHIEPGAELRFEPGAVAVVGAIDAIGTAEAPIRFLPHDADGRFAGLLSLGTAGPNLLQYVEVERTTGIQRGPWQTTGGVTLLGQRAVVHNCTFRGSLAEDALNIVGVEVDVNACTFDGGTSDLFDGDFVHGTVTGCKFLNSDSDALDVSGSVLTVTQCSFTDIGDKALSIGEGSTVTARDCHVHSAMIAASSKDRSKVRIERLTVDAVERFVAVAYIKKPEFGPATMAIQGLVYNGGSAPVHLAQTGCSLVVDGQAVATRDLDVKALYEQKILGK